ncbi:MAG: hypothetical protein U7123_18565 [Potamolinea sp.]
MIHRLLGFFLSQQRHQNIWLLPLSGLLLTVGCATNASTLEAVAQLQKQTVASSAVAKSEEVSIATLAQLPVSTAEIVDGVYLYGQSSEPEEMGKEYIVFESRQGKVVGAMYLPKSEYTCFYGTLDSKQMNLTVVNPYDQTAITHKIARTQSTQIAAAGGQINIQNSYDSLKYPHAVGLEGYQAISKVSDNDQRILSECRDNYQAQVWN